LPPSPTYKIPGDYEEHIIYKYWEWDATDLDDESNYSDTNENSKAK